MSVAAQPYLTFTNIPDNRHLPPLPSPNYFFLNLCLGIRTKHGPHQNWAS